MKLIVGLGNPGEKYRATRHNVGANAVRQFCADNGVVLKKGIFASSASGKARLDTVEVMFAVPLTYMNLSGPAVGALVRRHRIQLEDVLVVHDDLDIELGRIKARLGGSAGGHNGLKSVIGSLGSPDFCRLRLGIGRPHEGFDTAEFVLMPFTSQEEQEAKVMVGQAGEELRTWAVSGISKTMNKFNR
jgi:peptidyl-tRNA hydrolase, PTH1 family